MNSKADAGSKLADGKQSEAYYINTITNNYYKIKRRQKDCGGDSKGLLGYIEETSVKVHKSQSRSVSETTRPQLPITPQHRQPPQYLPSQMSQQMQGQPHPQQYAPYPFRQS